ncbi:MAG: DUF4442 domain-containing protein [Bacteroidia bacterium]|nr:DUF4442 domain-containing protein [Bacteroidia bacterium]
METNKRLLRKANWQLFLFGRVKIPLIGYCRPRVKELSEETIRIRIPLRRRTRNHVSSMYLGVMTVGADLASGFLAFHLSKLKGVHTNPVFKGMKAEYYKRAESAVDFICRRGNDIALMIDEMKATGERITRPIEVVAECKGEEVARFIMEISLKQSRKLSKQKKDRA